MLAVIHRMHKFMGKRIEHFDGIGKVRRDKNFKETTNPSG